MLARRSQSEQLASWPQGDDGPDRRKHHREARLRAIVEEHVDSIARVLRNSGVQPADIDDLVQSAFITAARRLDDIRVGAEKGFLIRTAFYLAAHLRRTLARRRELPYDEVADQGERTATPEDLLDLNQSRALLDRVLDQMAPDLRRVFVLFEFEQLSAPEIAFAVGIPRGTVASRLRRARTVFRMAANRLLSQRAAE